MCNVRFYADCSPSRSPQNKYFYNVLKDTDELVINLNAVSLFIAQIFCNSNTVLLIFNRMILFE